MMMMIFDMNVIVKDGTRRQDACGILRIKAGNFNFSGTICRLFFSHSSSSLNFNSVPIIIRHYFTIQLELTAELNHHFFSRTFGFWEN